jgi:hypothetical protein
MNTRVDCKTKTEANSSQRDFAKADEQENLRRLEEKYRKPFILEEGYERDRTNEREFCRDRNLPNHFITERDAKTSKPEATSGRNTRFDYKTKTEANCRQRDCANADVQETLRRLEDKYRKPSILEEGYERDRPNEREFCRHRNLPPRLQNRNLPPHLITERDAKNSKPEATSGRNARVECKTKTEANSRQRDCANPDEQETLRRLEEKYRKPSILVEGYERDRPNEREFCRHRNLPSRLQNRYLPNRLQQTQSREMYYRTSGDISKSHVSSKLTNNWQIVTNKSRKSKISDRTTHGQLPISVLPITNRYNALRNTDNH